MAISKTDRLRLLNFWQIRMGERYYPFNQVDDKHAINAPAVWLQYERDLLAFALVDSWREFAFWLGYNPTPIYDIETLELSTQRPICQTVSLKKTGWLNNIGRRGTELIAEDATITYSDEDGDSVDETATIDVTLGDATIEELQVFFRVADGAPAEADVRYEIYPVTWTDNGDGSATGVFHRGLAVTLENWETPYKNGDPDKRNGLDPLVDANFLELVNVYRVYPDPTNAVELVLPVGLRATTETIVGVTAVITDVVDAEFQITLPDAVAEEDVAGARRVRIHYYGGLPYVDGRMQAELETALMRFALTNAPLETKNISLRQRDAWKKDHEDLFDGASIPPEYVNPFGIKRGQWEAWRIVARMADEKRGHVMRPI